MRRRLCGVIAAVLAASLLTSCGGKTSKPTPLPTLIPSPTSDFPAPTATGPEPSMKVAAFYYAWYGTPKYDTEWIHWTQNGHQPPADIASDYYPALGPYSSNDPGVVAQHMAWLRQAGVGVIIVSWWGRGARDERPIPLILKTADHYRIKVAFHIEPYGSRSADSLVEDIQYIYRVYGDSPAFFRSTATTAYSTGAQRKGLFFIWCSDSP